MKKIFLLAFVAICSITVSAQTNKGQFLIGGSGGFSISKEKESDWKQTNIRVAPNAGYFIIDNLAAGVRLNLNKTTWKDTEADYKESDAQFSLAPFVRYYFLNLGDNIKLLGDASFGFGSSKYKEPGHSETYDKFNQFTGAVGAAWFLNPHTALELTVGYNNYKEKNEDAVNGVNVNLGFQIHLDGCSKKK